jgi:5'-methylthioinosine phosphorylase
MVSMAVPRFDDIALAVIGGTGVYALEALSEARELVIDTPYGAPSAPARVGLLAGKRVAFLARHGEGHHLPPHRINYRANVWALHAIGAQRLLAINAVGGISAQYGPAMLGVPDQLIDYSWGRIGTFCEEADTPVQHVDMGEPYTPALRAQLLAGADRAGIKVVDGGCYGVTQGPRLETNAEIARMRRDGCDLVGMTGMPEAALARELGLQYACLALVANWAAGCDPVPHEITMAEVHANMEQASRHLPAIIERLL